jgi:hypothetical protein
MRRLDPPSQPVQAGSTMTIHDTSHLFPGPSRALAQAYGTNIERNLATSLELGRMDHARMWATVGGLLGEAPPSYDSVFGKSDARREREIWERGVVRRRLILDEM